MTVSRRIMLMLVALATGSATTFAAEPIAKPNAPVYREFIQGNPKAKVTVIEYASLTCGACKAFHDTVYPELKKNYIDTGKIRFVYRDYPLDGLAAGAALLARCAPGNRGTVMIDEMFKNQSDWVRAPNPLEPLRGYAQLAGMSSADVNACLKNEGIMNKIREVQEAASSAYKVQATPTFFINEDRLEAPRSYDVMAKALDRALAAAK